MRYYPIFLDLKGRRVVVVGGGNVAQRKAAALLKAGAHVTVISPNITRRLAAWISRKKITHIRRPYRDGDLDRAAIAFTATDNGEVNQAVAREADQKKIWINVADQSVPGDFIVPALFTRRGLMVAVSTGGKDPGLAKKIRDELRKGS
ncbi:MAG: bifunctional precorrin-2 dehydrogenase/sirohydrochlorin ferrochelatase [Nitrospiria bacterium]